MEFKTTEHMVTGGPCAEIWDGDTFVAGIYLHDDGVRVVSKYMDGVKVDNGYPPAATVILSER